MWDKAYDTEVVRAMLAAMVIDVSIPSKANRKVPVLHGRYPCSGRHLIDNLFVDIKYFRGLSTRYRKLAGTFCAGLHLVTWFVRTRGRKGWKSEYERTCGHGLGEAVTAEPRQYFCDFDILLGDGAVENVGCFGHVVVLLLAPVLDVASLGSVYVRFWPLV